WKMNKTLAEGTELVQEIKQKLQSGSTPQADVIICPPFTHLSIVADLLQSTNIGLGAQNCATEVNGAYTGEVSAMMISSTGAGYVIVGHSERRAMFGEANEITAKKVVAAIQAGLTPIFCCGETLAERESGQLFDVVKAQVSTGLFSLSAEMFAKVIVAYEPVWAIGTGLNATPQQAEEMHVFIRSLIRNEFVEGAAENTSILYGGSCKPSNAPELFAIPDVDGGLIGGASLTAKDFLGIVYAFGQ
ncbi:MAG: triose-phosphate isomerase, partial [Bacteroidetes bacterium]|nr:triose-phosphate isomerase [Bacteroidota bacterium]